MIGRTHIFSIYQNQKKWNWKARLVIVTPQRAYRENRKIFLFICLSIPARMCKSVRETDNKISTIIFRYRASGLINNLALLAKLTYFVCVIARLGTYLCLHCACMKSIEFIHSHFRYLHIAFRLLMLDTNRREAYFVAHNNLRASTLQN